MKKFEFLEDATADVSFLAYGKTLDELFTNAALAMFEVMIDTSTVKPETQREITVSSPDLEGLMFSWLNELLFFVDAENMAFSEFSVRVEKNREYVLKAVCKGEKIDPEKHELRTVVKSATYHGMEITQNGLWKAKVIVDI